MQPPDLPQPPESEIAGFWRRVFALLIDTILLGAVGWILAFFWFDYFASLGPWGRLVGFALCLIYFPFLNSRLSGGQTLGKRVLHIRVVGRDGSAIGVCRAAVRYLILATPFFLNGAGIPTQLLLGWPGTVFSLLVFGFGTAIIYLIIFNRRTRQSLHDLILDTFVVKKAEIQAPITGRTWKGHYVVVAVLIGLIIVGTSFLTRLAGGDFFKPLLTVQQEIQKNPDLWGISVYEGATKFFGANGTTQTSMITVRAIVRKPMPDYQPVADQIARIVLEKNPRAKEKNQIIITIVHGYDIGIASFWRAIPYSMTPAQWQARLAVAAP